MHRLRRAAGAPGSSRAPVWIALGVHGLGLLGVVGYLARQWAAGRPWGAWEGLAALGGALLAVADGLLARALWADRSESTDAAPAPGPATVRPALPVRAAPEVRSAVRGPRLVAIGGGHGLSTLLRGLKTHTDDLTAIVTVADDGGSSGVLRQELGLPPPGDLRDCIAALAEAEPLMANLFQYRFGRGTRLDGHSFGNLFIAAMTGITGDFESGVSEVSRVLAVRGRILPSSLDDITLGAEIRRPAPEAPHALVHGQSRIAAADGEVERVFLQPERVKGYPEAIRALLRAELIVMGPGSLYTSVLPNLLIADIREAVRASGALRIYVANVATQPGETAGYDLGRHVEALERHVGEGLCEVIIGNDSLGHTLPPTSRSEMVRPTIAPREGLRVVLADLVDEQLPWRHDAAKLAEVVLAEYRAHRAGRDNAS